VGFGTNINITNAISLQIGSGYPLARKLNESPGRLYFSLSSELDKMFFKPKSRL
jgi:hypothetical protein